MSEAAHDAVAETPLTTLLGRGVALAKPLQRIGIHRTIDLLLHLPTRYEDRSRLQPLGALRPGQAALVEARVELVDVVTKGRRALLCRVSDGTGALTLRFFHFRPSQRDQLQPGVLLRCYGEVRANYHSLEMVHPEYQILNPNSPPPIEKSLTPIYPTTEGLGQPRLRGLVRKGLATLPKQPVAELLPKAVLIEQRLMPLQEALIRLHQPGSGADPHELAEPQHPARRRLIFEELIAHQLSLRRLRGEIRRQTAPCLAGPADLREALAANMGFELTGAQRRVIGEILADIASPRPMMRLVQGDVGSGKTAVAAHAAIQAISSGHQVALMAPTELLAEQHWQNFHRWFSPLGMEVVWLSGRQKMAQRRQTLAAIADGQARIAIGTHALFQDEVSFQSLGLVIIDEQHRFGVQQRLALRDKGATARQYPHQLVMTATPIPRTLAMSVYADLDTSALDELPPGRTPVTTAVVSEERREEVIDRVRVACVGGAQVYWVCPLIEESDVLECQAAEETATRLTQLLPGLRVGLVHGRVKSAEREALMARFKAGELDLLVATTVIEVGVDVPNASLMIIENAERLGLSQLHQLRGRVGRGSAGGHCVLFYRRPLSGMAKARLMVMRDTTDGFEIARRDLELRGPGEFLGTRQSGDVRFRVADLLRDAALLPAAQAMADRLLSDYPETASPLIDRWLGEADRYAQA